MIICAALRVRIESHTSCETTVIHCRRHGEGIQLVKTLLNHTPKGFYIEILEQGFIDHNGNFLNRTEAHKHAISIGQINQTTLWYMKDHYSEDAIPELYSEDLY